MSAKSDKLFQKRRKSQKAMVRRPASLTTKRRVLIVSEGEVTEHDYFEALKSHLDLKAVELKICGKECDSSPMAVVRYALDRAAKEGAHDQGGYNDVYCVFDRDTHVDFEKAHSEIFKANKPRSGFKGEKIMAIPSHPSFEFWLLLHFVYTRTPFAATGGKTVAEVVTSELKKHKPFEEFTKSLTKKMLEVLLENTDTAIQYAEKIKQDAETTGDLNPSTDVHVLVKALYDLQEQ